MPVIKTSVGLKMQRCNFSLNYNVFWSIVPHYGEMYLEAQQLTFCHSDFFCLQSILG